ncbi:MAG: S24 family peptidase, partial [Anaeromyxobacteraceae bacterium]
MPLYDLSVKAGAFGDAEQPKIEGWARLPGHHLDDDMFVAKVAGRSMEPGIVDGAYGLFRAFPIGKEASLTALDNRRVIVQLNGKDQDPENGRYTLKRWRVTRRAATGAVEEVTLRPDNHDFKPILLTPADGDVRVVA